MTRTSRRGGQSKPLPQLDPEVFSVLRKLASKNNKKKGKKLKLKDILNTYHSSNA